MFEIYGGRGKSEYCYKEQQAEFLIRVIRPQSAEDNIKKAMDDAIS
jgi:hypothetical protein